MSDSSKILTTLGLLLTATLFVQPAQADSWRHDRHDRNYRHERSYHHSRYYPRPHYPPFGRVEVGLPGGWITVVVGGSRYFYCDGVYYNRAPRGYVVVPPLREVVRVVETRDDDGPYTVNIPNTKSKGYTSVKIERTKDGFVGPQGEFYDEFPSVEQLKVMYSDKY